MLAHMHIDSVHDLHVTVQQFDDFITVSIENQGERDSIVFFLRDMDEAESLAAQIRDKAFVADPAS